MGDPRKFLPEGWKTETEDEEARGLLVGWLCASLTALETILRNHIFLEAVILYIKGAILGRGGGEVKTLTCHMVKKPSPPWGYTLGNTR